MIAYVWVPISLLWAVAVGVVVPAGLFIYEYRIERKVPYVTLTPFKRGRDPKDGSVIEVPGEGDFDPRHGHYMKLGEVLITLASASLNGREAVDLLKGQTFDLVLMDVQMPEMDGINAMKLKL